MADNTSRRGAADLGMLLMVLAFVVIGAFMYYLSVRAAEERALDIVEAVSYTHLTLPTILLV